MEIKCRAWNPTEMKTMGQNRWLEPEYYKDPATAADHAINLAERALKIGGNNLNVKTTITLSLDEYRLLISDAQKKAKEEGCKEGREEAWDLARRIVTTGDGCYAIDEVNKVFGNMNILRTPIDEVLAKDKEYQKERKVLHIGDEVEFCGLRGYVIEILLTDEVRVLTKIYGTFTVSCKNCKKTGRHSEEIERAMASFEEGEC